MARSTDRPKQGSLVAPRVVAGDVATAVNPPNGHLLRILGLGFNVAVIIGSTLGIGILRAPGPVAAQFHEGLMIVAIWVLGGLYTLLGSVCLTELGAMIPQAGGYYVYARRAFGDWVGFAVGWTDWVTYCAVLGYVAIGMAELLGVLVPALAAAARPIAIALLVGFVVLQWIGLRVSSRFQEWATALKCLAFLVLVVAGLVMSGPVSSPTPAPQPPGLVAALQLVIITYGGWQSALYFVEENHDPNRNLPRAMIGGVVAVIAIYVLVNFSLLAILPIPDLAKAILPAAEAARVIAGPRGGELVTALSIISLPPMLNAILMIGTRILFAMGRDRLLWSRAAAVNTGGTPSMATLATSIVAVILIGTGTFQRVGAVAAFFFASNCCISCLALIALRRREPLAPRPYRAWCYPWSAMTVCIGTLAFLVDVVITDPTTAITAMSLLAVGIIAFLWTRYGRGGSQR